MAIALHHPEKLYKKNRTVAGMAKSKLKEYASTGTKDLPKYKPRTVADMAKGK